MERLKNRCLVASFSGHFLLLLALLVGPLLITKRDIPMGMPVITYIPANVLEGIIGTGGQSGGGTAGSDSHPPKQGMPPKPQPPPRNSITPPLVAEITEIPRTSPPQRSPSKPSKPKSEHEAEKEAELRPLPKTVIPDLTPLQQKKRLSQREKKNEPQPNKEATSETGSKSTSKSSVQPNLKRAKNQIDEGVEKAKRDFELAEASRRAGEERGALINSVAQKIGSGVGVGLSTEGLSGIGIGIGGDGHASYGQVVMGIYQKAWMEPADVEGTQHVVKAVVIVGRDGRVISARIVGSCRSETMNRSVQRALDGVRFIAPFPSEMKDLSKLFPLSFDLQAKRNAG